MSDDPSGPDVTQLWEEPDAIGQRDLFHGVGGRDMAPDPRSPFTFIRTDRTGYSPGFDVRDAEGVEWSVKTGPEAQSEVAVSRLLWAIGFHQPPVYYLPAWTMTGGQAAGRQPAGRFRPTVPEWDAVDEWSWYENPFVRTAQFRGLVVANLLVNNWDWKTSNNRIYEVRSERGTARRQYIVRDLGASLGKIVYRPWREWFPRMTQGSRNAIEDFESQPFIKAVDGTRIEFQYRGIHDRLIETVTAKDVLWVCRLMERLSDAQLRDAFRAAGYDDDVARRFAAALRGRVAEGLRLADIAARVAGVR